MGVHELKHIDKPIHARQVSRELGVRYVLDGGIQTAFNRIRVLVQLIDANSGEQIWTDRFDRKIVVVQFVHQRLAGMNAMAA